MVLYGGVSSLALRRRRSHGTNDLGTARNVSRFVVLSRRRRRRRVTSKTRIYSINIDYVIEIRGRLWGCVNL